MVSGIKRSRLRVRRLGKQLRRAAFGARNAVKVVRGGRFVPPYEASYELAANIGFVRLRHYPQDPPELPLTCAQPILLVPPLMVTSQVYDIAPDLSAIAFLRRAGFDVWLVDFGAPEDERGGLDRTLDQHVLAIDAAIDLIRERTGEPVHLAGYSQGGMFAYQVAAYRKGEGVASVITFGAPVDMQKNLGADVNRDLLANLARGAWTALARPFDAVSGIPGTFSSFGFKMLNPVKELQYLRMMLGALDDREALARLEPTRRFLGGEGFVAWPGPAFRSFVDDVIVHNRMMSGGFVINGRTVTLADIRAPILCFVGVRDEFARPRSVRAIAHAAPSAELHERAIDAGHFGLVVGSRAMDEVWPTVTRWILWSAGAGPRPTELVDVRARAGEPTPPAATRETPSELAREAFEALWERLGLSMRDLTESARWVRWQSPRLLRLLDITNRRRVSIGKLLSERARERPDDTFFLWRGRAYSYAEGDARVNQILAVLLELGVGPEARVGLLMDNHPDYLTALAALSRLGAVAVLINPQIRGDVLEHALSAGKVGSLIASRERLAAALEAFDRRRVYLMGAHDDDTRARGVVSIAERLDVDRREPPAGVDADPGRPDDLAVLMYTSGTTGRSKAARISNRRMLLAATLAAVGGGFTPSDTIYCGLPLYHATGLLLGACGALVGGSRLVLAPRFSVSTFWDEIRRDGVTVVFYVGEMIRFLVRAPEVANEKRHSIRLLFGNGMRADVWREALRRFGRVRVLEFYAATEGNVLLANLTGEKIGSVGRVPIGIVGVELVRYDYDRGEVARDEDGFAILCDDDEVGLLIAQIHPFNPFSRFDGYTDHEATSKKIIHSVLRVGDAWFSTGDLLRRDADGDFWFIDRVGDTFRWRGENISTEEVEAELRKAPGVAQAAVYGVSVAGEEGRAGMAAVVLDPGVAALDGAALYAAIEGQLSRAALPRYVRVVDDLETTGTFKVIKRKLQEEGASLAAAGAGRLYQLEGAAYTPVT